MEARAELPESQIPKGEQCLTGQNEVTEICGVQNALSNHIDPLSGAKESPRTSGNRDEGEATSNHANGPDLNTLKYWRTQFVMSALGVRPELACMIAALVFGVADHD